MRICYSIVNKYFDFAYIYFAISKIAPQYIIINCTIVHHSFANNPFMLPIPNKLFRLFFDPIQFAQSLLKSVPASICFVLLSPFPSFDSCQLACIEHNLYLFVCCRTNQSDIDMGDVSLAPCFTDTCNHQLASTGQIRTTSM